MFVKCAVDVEVILEETDVNFLQIEYENVYIVLSKCLEKFDHTTELS